MLSNRNSVIFSRATFAHARRLCSRRLNVAGIATLRDSIEEKLKAVQQQQQQALLRGCNKTTIYRVPSKLRDIQPEAYKPHFISIGPYHRSPSDFQELEGLKWVALNRVVGNGGPPQLDRLLSVLEEIEPEAREAYSDNVGLSRDEFVKMMLLDGCFIVELFRELQQTKFKSSSLFPKRWMLPVVRRDLIVLENQLPMKVVKKLFEETMILKSDTNSEGNNNSIESLALTFFDPLMPREKDQLQESIASITSASKNFHHLLDVFHSSITFGMKVNRGEERHMYRPLTELKKAGIKVRVLENTQPLGIRFERGVIRMPGLLMDNHTGCFLKNLLAYEQCHDDCKPDVTAYLFFLDKLVNSAEDVATLNYEGVIQHSLGNNDEVSKLISDICKEVEYDGKHSYLYNLIEDLNRYSGNMLVMLKSRLKQDYFGNIWVSISTLAALLLLYLTLLQASCDAIAAKKKGSHEIQGWWVRLHLFLLDPIEGFNDLKAYAVSSVLRVTQTSHHDDDPCLDA